MKKIVAFLLVVVLAFSVACAQSKSLPADITCDKILNTAKDTVFYENTTSHIKDKNNMDTYAMAMWSDGVFEQCEEYGMLSDYAICYSSDNTTYEISVLKANTDADVTRLVSILERRKQTLEGGVKAAYDPNFKKLMQSSKIITDGQFAILLITNDNNAAIKAIEKLKQ